jgi:hypothetical protein
MAYVILSNLDVLLGLSRGKCRMCSQEGFGYGIHRCYLICLPGKHMPSLVPQS